MQFNSLLKASTALAAVLATPALAQGSATGGQLPVAAEPTSSEAAGASGQIEAIVVTARRREESLQDAPITVTAFTGAQLQAKGITDIRTLVQATPGVNFDVFPRAAPRPFFRGIGSSNQGAGADPSSVAFLDGVYLSRAAMLGIDFYDMQ